MGAPEVVAQPSRPGALPTCGRCGRTRPSALTSTWIERKRSKPWGCGSKPTRCVFRARGRIGRMPHSWSATTTINRPIDQVFAFLADGTNDTKFSPRVQEIKKLTDGPPGVGTVYSSAVKDAGLKTSREFELTEFEQPTKIRWTERSKNAITVPEGGYDLEPAGD